ncbi:SAM-dependent methyltransferase [Prauserella alba]|uniref:SAM-dependent methyltransferase n=1 Tax=Prauserella alba TaxID=176898 RepID=UPI0020A30AC0|nr:SAM-dependent methyltransferase [Prauserella alba]
MTSTPGRNDAPEPVLPTVIDPNVPSIARAYDATLGGKDNYEVDREVARQLREVTPEVTTLAWDNRDFLIRATRFVVGTAGIDQVVDVGSGLPTVENTHDVALRLNRDTCVVYVDIDPIVIAHGRALVEDHESVHCVQGDLTEPQALFADPAVAGRLEWDRPMALYQVGTLHHVADDRDPAAMMRAYIDALPSGSQVVLSHFFNPGDEDPEAAEVAERLEQAFLHSPMGTGRFRTREEIAAYFDGLDLLEPGLVTLAHWWPEGPPPQNLDPARRLMIGAVARKP